MRILIIDDDNDMSALVRQHLLAEWPNAIVRMTGSGDGMAHKVIDIATHFDVIFLDYDLFDEDVFNILLLLRRRAPDVPVIFTTSKGDEMLAVSAFKAGAADYLPKSRLSEVTLINTTREALRSRSKYPWLGTGRNPGALTVREMSIKGYQVESRLARSALSTVYRAIDLASSETIALKVLRGIVDERHSETLERFLREYEMVSQIDHANIVRIDNVGVADDQFFIAMEFVPGGTLRQLLQAGPVGDERAAELFDQLLDALDAIHRIGILHRDLKPGNVMLRDDGSACLIDFGLAKHLQVEQSLTVPGRIYGTPYYMSPEQGQGLVTDERSDLYSLGVILYELLTGAKPYLASTPVALIYKHCHAPLPRLPEAQGHWQPLLDRLLAKECDERPATGAAVRDILTRCRECKI